MCGNRDLASPCCRELWPGTGIVIARGEFARHTDRSAFDVAFRQCCHALTKTNELTP
jgi:hypothetical protein